MDRQNNGFAARLQRIEARGAAEKPNLEPPIRSVPKGNTHVWFLLGAIALVAIAGAAALVVLNETTLEPAPEPLAEIVAPETPSFIVDRAEKRPEGAPLRVLGDRGWTLWPGQVAAPDHAELAVAEVFSGFDPSLGSGVPGALIPFDVNATCTLRTPAAGEVIRNLRLARATGESGVHVISNAEMARALLGHIESLHHPPKRYRAAQAASGRMGLVDVVLTDTSGPIYLVLQSFRGDTLWNLHLARGVDLAHVAMIGDNSALVGVPEGTTFEALRISDFVTDFEFGSNDRPRDCMVAPYRKPADHWVAVKKAAKGNMLFENQVYTFNAGYQALKASYRDTLGVDASTNLTVAEGAAHMLSGPLPLDPLAYRGLEGRVVHVTRNDLVLTSDAAVAQAHLERLTLAAGGDLASLDPAPVGRD